MGFTLESNPALDNKFKGPPSLFALEDLVTLRTEPTQENVTWLCWQGSLLP